MQLSNCALLPERLHLLVENTKDNVSRSTFQFSLFVFSIELAEDMVSDFSFIKLRRSSSSPEKGGKATGIALVSLVEADLTFEFEVLPNHIQRFVERKQRQSQL